MKEDKGNRVLSVLYIAAVVILAVLYFMVPERKEFIRFELTWWGEFIAILASFFGR